MFIFSFANVAFYGMSLVRELLKWKVVMMCLAPVLFVAVEIRLRFSDVRRWALGLPADHEIVKTFGVTGHDIASLTLTELCKELAFPSVERLVVFYRFGATEKLYSVVVDPQLFDALRDNVVPYTADEVREYLKSAVGGEDARRYLTVTHDGEDVTDVFNMYAGPKANWYDDVAFAIHDPTTMIRTDGTWLLTGNDKHVTVLTESGLEELDIQVFESDDEAENSGSGADFEEVPPPGDDSDPLPDSRPDIEPEIQPEPAQGGMYDKKSI